LVYRDLDARLASSPFIAGNRFSAADITAAVTIDFATKALDLPIPTESNALHRRYELVSVRASMGA
jgi:glutathione S-transferase